MTCSATSTQPVCAQADERTVLALHCSGASGHAWRKLAAVLGREYTVIAPDLWGSGTNRSWTGERAFTIDDETAPLLEIIDRSAAPVHLVGHSYGGGVALALAAARPAKIASLSLYEPTCFHVLRSMGREGRLAFSEIAMLAHDVDDGVLTGAYERAARRFVDYWNGENGWESLSQEQRQRTVQTMFAACLQFRVLMHARPALSDYAQLETSTLVIKGERSPRPTKLIVRNLVRSMRSARRAVVADAGHMGPFTHADRVNALIAEHITEADATLYRIRLAQIAA